MLHREELIRIHTSLVESFDDLQYELASLPEGELVVEQRGDKYYYSQRFQRQGNRKKSRKVGITNDTEKILALVRKKYIGRALGVIEKDIRVLEMAIKHYQTYDEASLMLDFVNKYPGTEAGLYHGMQSDEEWADDYKRQVDFYAESLKDVSLSGTMMRSKNEVFIASRLDHYGIPYRYEASIPHPDVYGVPDFTIRRPRDGKIIYWEHLGRTSDGHYMKGNHQKFAYYESADIVPWDNLILTYDRTDGSIDAKIIEAMIQGWLL